MAGKVGAHSANFIDRVGQRVGRGVIVRLGPPLIFPSGQRQTRYWLECDCQQACYLARASDLFSDPPKKRSCGCLRSESAAEHMRTVATRHGQAMFDGIKTVDRRTPA